MSTMDVVSTGIWLLIYFQIKHFIADYYLQGPYMLQKFRPDWGFFLPLAVHAGVNAICTLPILLILAPHLWYLCLVDFVIHFVMDRIKAGPKYLGRFKALSAKDMNYILLYKNTTKFKKFEPELKSNRAFWLSLGFDQMVHHLTHYFIIFVVIMDAIWSH